MNKSKLFLIAVLSVFFTQNIIALVDVIIVNRYKEPIKISKGRSAQHILVNNDEALLLSNFDRRKENILAVSQSSFVLPKKMHYYSLKIKGKKGRSRIFLIEIRDFGKLSVDYSLYQFKKGEEAKKYRDLVEKVVKEKNFLYERVGEGKNIMEYVKNLGATKLEEFKKRINKDIVDVEELREVSKYDNLFAKYKKYLHMISNAIEQKAVMIF